MPTQIRYIGQLINPLRLNSLHDSEINELFKYDIEARINYH